VAGIAAGVSVAAFREDVPLPTLTFRSGCEALIKLYGMAGPQRGSVSRSPVPDGIDADDVLIWAVDVGAVRFGNYLPECPKPPRALDAASRRYAAGKGCQSQPVMVLTRPAMVVPILVNIVPSAPPAAVTPATMASEMRPTTSPYSSAFEPASFFRMRWNIDFRFDIFRPQILMIHGGAA
jgi:hypothetical protein